MPNPSQGFFWGVENCATDKKTAAYRSRKDTHHLYLPCSSNSLIFTGTLLTGASALKHPCATQSMYDDCQLVALDFDLVPALKNKWELPMEYIAKWIGQPTFLVRTGSGSCHAYFLIPDLRHVIHNTQRNLPLPGTDFLKSWGVECVDVRGFGGVLFAPGTKFHEHQYQYKILRDIPPLRIELTVFLSLLKQVVTDLPLIEDVMHSKNIAKKHRIKNNQIELPFKPPTETLNLSAPDLSDRECCGFNLGEFIHGKLTHEILHQAGSNVEVAVWGATVQRLNELHYSEDQIKAIFLTGIPWADPATVNYQVHYKETHPGWRQKAIHYVRQNHE